MGNCLQDKMKCKAEFHIKYTKISIKCLIQVDKFMCVHIKIRKKMSPEIYNNYLWIQMIFLFFFYSFTFSKFFIFIHHLYSHKMLFKLKMISASHSPFLGLILRSVLVKSQPVIRKICYFMHQKRHLNELLIVRQVHRQSHLFNPVG